MLTSLGLQRMQRSRPGAQASNSDRARQACLGELIQRGKNDLLSAALARGASFGRLVFHHFEEHVTYDEASLQLRTKRPHALVDLPAPGRKPKTPASSSDQRVASHEVKWVKVLQTRYLRGYLISKPDPISATDFVVITVPVSTCLRSACLVRALSESSVVGKTTKRRQLDGVSRLTGTCESAKRAVDAQTALQRGGVEEVTVRLRGSHGRDDPHQRRPLLGVHRLRVTSRQQPTNVAVVISERIEVFVGDPGEAAALFRMCAVRTFCPGEGKPGAPNGFAALFAERPLVEHRPGRYLVGRAPGPGHRHVQVESADGDAHLRSVDLEAIQPYPRHRWKGASEAVCDIGLRSVFHHVLTPAFVRFASVKLGQVAVDRIVAQSSRKGLKEDAGVFQAPIADACAEGGVTTPGSDATDQPPIEDGEPGQWAKTHAKFLQNALGWLSLPAPSVRGQTLILRNVMVVLQRLPYRHLHLGSIRWENEQRAKCVRASAARGTEETSALQQLRLLLCCADLWILLPEK